MVRYLNLQDILYNISVNCVLYLLKNPDTICDILYLCTHISILFSYVCMYISEIMHMPLLTCSPFLGQIF